MSRRKRHRRIFAANQYARLGAVTTAPNQTVTIAEWNCTLPTLIDWGDGQTTLHPASQNGVAVNHEYASAGAYTIRMIVSPAAVREINLADSQISLNSVYLQRCVGVTYLRLYGVGESTVFNSAHIAAMELTTLILSFTATITFNSAHIAAMELTTLQLYISTGTVTFNSSHIAAMPLTSLYLYISTGTVTFNSSHIASKLLTFLYLSSFPGTATLTLARADFDGWPNLPNFTFTACNLTQGEVDTVLLGLYDGLATRTAANGSISLGGTNAAPSGILQAQCPPTTGKECAYELSHDSCGVNPTKTWLTVSITA